jgi:Ni,Fe-hydrogenase I large subunit
LQVQEYTGNSWYNDTPLWKGRHPWRGRTRPNPNKVGAYTYAKTPRYLWAAGEADGGPDDFVPYEVGPLARMVSNAALIGGGPATTGQVLAVDAGAVGLYYPGIVNDVDTVLGGALAIPGGKVGVFPAWDANLTGHLTWALGAGVYYLPASSVPNAALANLYKTNYMGDGTLDRIAARTLETYYVGMQMVSWFSQLNPLPVNWYTGVNPNNPVVKDPTDTTYLSGISPRHSNMTRLFNWGSSTEQVAPKKSKGAGLTEAPRGALGHWIRIGKKGTPSYRGKVSRYQIITPTAWNISPKDHNNARGPLEESIWGTPVVDEQEPIEILRVIHSYDLCCACTVHVTNVKKEKTFKATLEALP